MDLIPYPIGPLNPQLQDIVVALVLFACCFVFFVRFSARVNRLLETRDDLIGGGEERAEELRERARRERAGMEAVLAEARQDAARTRQRAAEEGTALIARARSDGQRQRDAILTEGRARIEAERGAALAELRAVVPDLASALASSVVGEPITARAERGG